MRRWWRRAERGRRPGLVQLGHGAVGHAVPGRHISYCGGGGGGGWYGGGPGNHQSPGITCGGGGGGSGHLDASVTGGLLTQATGGTPGNNSDPAYPAGVGVGGLGSSAVAVSGARCVIVVTW